MQSGQENQVITYADRTVERLQKRFRRMILSGKLYNVAIITVAREIVEFIREMKTGIMNKKVLVQRLSLFKASTIYKRRNIDWLKYKRI